MTEPTRQTILMSSTTYGLTVQAKLLFNRGKQSLPCRTCAFFSDENPKPIKHYLLHMHDLGPYLGDGYSTGVHSDDDRTYLTGVAYRRAICGLCGGIDPTLGGTGGGITGV